MTYEIMMRDHDKDKVQDKTKIIALKSPTQKEEKENEELSGNELEDIALLTRRYKKYMMFKKVKA